MAKTYGVLGLGKFGGAVARELSLMGCDVIAVDIKESVVKEIQHQVSYAVIADVTDIDTMKEIGLGDTDGVFISIAEELEASIMAALIAKELGVPHVVAKASSKMHGKVLEKVGVDRVVFPEREMGIRLAKNIMAGNFMDMIDLSSKYSLVELVVPKSWIGKSLISLDARKKYGLNVVALKRNDEILINIPPDMVFNEGDIIIVVGSNDSIGALND